MKINSIPPLRNAAGARVTETGEKTDLFAETFRPKCQLPDESPLLRETELALADNQMASFSILPTRWCKKVLTAIDPFKATGLDLLLGRILKECASELAYVVVQIARRLLQEGRSPECLRAHWLHPLFKHTSPSNPLRCSWCISRQSFLRQPSELQRRCLWSSWRAAGRMEVPNGVFVGVSDAET